MERTEYQSKIEDIRKIRSELDAYAQALHKKKIIWKECSGIDGYL